jgi:PEP-CTERM motif
MNRLRCIVALLFAVFGPYVYADGVPFISANITYVTVSMGPNNGSGDNASFTMIGPGTQITGTAGMACFDWCSGDITNNPVSLSQLFLGPFNSATVNGVSYDPNSDFTLFCCAFSDSGNLNSSVSGQVGSGDTFAQLGLTLPCCGAWNLTFNTFPEGQAFVHGTFAAGTPPSPVPEPGAIGLLATGLAGVVALIRRRPLICRRGTETTP